MRSTSLAETGSETPGARTMSAPFIACMSARRFSAKVRMDHLSNLPIPGVMTTRPDHTRTDTSPLRAGAYKKKDPLLGPSDNALRDAALMRGPFRSPGPPFTAGCPPIQRRTGLDL